MGYIPDKSDEMRVGLLTEFFWGRQVCNYDEVNKVYKHMEYIVHGSTENQNVSKPSTYLGARFGNFTFIYVVFNILNVLHIIERMLI